MRANGMIIHYQRDLGEKRSYHGGLIRTARNARHDDCYRLVSGPECLDDMIGGTFSTIEIRNGASWLVAGAIFMRNGKKYFYRGGNLYKMEGKNT